MLTASTLRCSRARFSCGSSTAEETTQLATAATMISSTTAAITARAQCMRRRRAVIQLERNWRGEMARKAAQRSQSPTADPIEVPRRLALVDFRTISSDGQRHVVSVAGEGPDIVLLHGFPDTPYSWSEIEAALVAAGWRVTVPWLRGYHPDNIVAGRPYDPETLGRDALELVARASV